MTKDCKRLQKITTDYHGFKGVYSRLLCNLASTSEIMDYIKTHKKITHCGTLTQTNYRPRILPTLFFYLFSVTKFVPLAREAR